MEDLNLSGDDKKELVIGEEVLKDQEGCLDLCAVAKFFTDQSLNFNFVKSRLASILKPKRSVSIRDIGERRLLSILS